MPSLRKRVSSYFRQLSFYNEPREKKYNVNENSFVTKYLEGQITVKDGSPILYGKNPTDLPNYDLGLYDVGPTTIVGCYSGPNGGLTTVKRTEKHLSVPDTDIDFIDTQDEVEGATGGGEDDPILPESWNRKTDYAFGISDSLYDRNQVTKNRNGDPIADCFGIIARGDSAILAVADGVNWGEKASIAAKSAIHGCLHYLDKTIFNDTKPFDEISASKADAIISQNRVSNTREVFVCLLRAFHCAHDLILENQGMLTTLTVAVVLPLKVKDEVESVCCVCNVGDTLAYVYSHKYGVRELTKGSHDVNCNRDMRDALGALGPVDGINPELSNLTLSITTVHKGDIIMVASDGLTDNFDPNVCKFTVNTKDALKPKRSVAKDAHATSSKEAAPAKPPRKTKPENVKTTDNPLKVQFLRENSLEAEGRAHSTFNPRPRQPPVKTGATFARSKTSLDMRAGAKIILRNEDGVPFVSPVQRYEISLLLMEDILKRGISGQDLQCTTAKKACENLVSFAFSISSAKRHTLEDADLYFDNVNGVMVEVSQQEKKLRRRKGLERVQNLPGKLDHVSIVAYNVGNYAHAY
ncbi:PP2C-like domain-containing protein CG9801 isoform X2 [Photinus pyralis]|nr:PP2C-like domain-containing protein CG9801 isoform X2 [Photinus pyralis]